MEEVASKQLERQIAGTPEEADNGAGEEELIRLCLKGRPEAFSVLVRRYQDRVFNVIFRICRNREDAEELAQEAFLRAFEKLRMFRGGSRFYTWLFRIAMNLTLSRKRRGGKVKFLSMSAGEEDSGRMVGEMEMAGIADRRVPSPENAAVGRETAERISQAIAELDEEFRTVVVLRDIEDMEYCDISEVLGIPPGTVKSRLHRGRSMLKEKLADLVE